MDALGILPPLRTPHHPVNSQPDVGDYRQGFTVKRNKKGTFVDIGMDKLAFCKEQLSVKRIFDFKITKIAKKEVIVTPDKPDDVYWGYNVMSSNKSLKNSLKLIKPDLVVETTRYGDYIDSIFDELKPKVDECKSMVFKSPEMKFGFLIIALWNGIVVLTPKMMYSLNALFILSIASFLFLPYVISFEIIES